MSPLERKSPESTESPEKATERVAKFLTMVKNLQMVM